MMLSSHFSLEELTRSDVALRKGLDNTPDAETIANLTELANGLEKVRELCRHAIHISSGYRSLKVNSAIGSKPTSAHVKGFAADFTCPDFGSVSDVCHAIMDSTIDYDQLIREFDTDNTGWVHISFDPQMRRMNLTIDNSGTRQGIA